MPALVRKLKKAYGQMPGGFKKDPVELIKYVGRPPQGQQP